MSFLRRDLWVQGEFHPSPSSSFLFRGTPIFPDQDFTFQHLVTDKTLNNLTVVGLKIAYNSLGRHVTPVLGQRHGPLTVMEGLRRHDPLISLPSARAVVSPYPCRRSESLVRTRSRFCSTVPVVEGVRLRPSSVVCDQYFNIVVDPLPRFEGVVVSFV